MNVVNIKKLDKNQQIHIKSRICDLKNFNKIIYLKNNKNFKMILQTLNQSLKKILFQIK